MSTVLFDAPGPRARVRHRVLTILTVAVLLAILAVVLWRLRTQGQLTQEIWEPFVTPRLMTVLLEGLWHTITAAAAAITLAIVFGLIFGTAKLSEHAWVRWPAWLVVEFFRAVPLLMLILVIFFVYQTQLGSYWSLVFGLTLYNGAVLAEVFRAGINAVPIGQTQAGLAIGLRKSQVMTIILLPQAIRIMLPAITSQCVIALKDTSLGYIILAPGLTFAGQLIWGEFDNRLATALVLAAMYIVVNATLTWGANILQARVTPMRR